MARRDAWADAGQRAHQVAAQPQVPQPRDEHLPVAHRALPEVGAHREPLVWQQSGVRPDASGGALAQSALPRQGPQVPAQELSMAPQEALPQ